MPIPPLPIILWPRRMKIFPHGISAFSVRAANLKSIEVKSLCLKGAAISILKKAGMQILKRRVPAKSALSCWIFYGMILKKITVGTNLQSPIGIKSCGAGILF